MQFGDEEEEKKKQWIYFVYYSAYIINALES
jgi:hypothetical protein